MAPQDYSGIPGIQQDPMAGDMSAPVAQPVPAAPALQLGPTDSDVLKSAFPSAVGYVDGGKLKPENVLNDPNASEDQKLQALQLIKSQEQEKANQIAEAEMKQIGEAQQNLQAYQQRMSEVESFNQEASQRGLKPMSMPDPKKFGLTPDMIAQLSHPAVQQVAGAAQEQKQKEDQQVQQAKQDMVQQVQAQKKLENQQLGQDRAVLNAQEQLQKAMDSLDKEQAELSNIDPDRWWNSRTTGQKILGYIAVALGGGPTDSRNAGYEGIMNAIDKDIAAQKVNQEKALSLRSNSLKRAQLEIQKFEAIAKDEEQKRQAKLMQQQLEQVRQQTNSELLIRKRVANAVTSGDGITAEEAMVIDPEGKLRANLIPLPNGKFKAASSPEAAKKFGEWNTGMVGAQRLAQDLEKQVKDLSVTDKLTPSMWSAKKKTVDETVQALVGQLRLPMTGPGILTDKEFDRLVDKVIGDPTSIMNAKSVSLAQIKHLQNLLNNMKSAQYEAAGVQVDRNDPTYKKQMKLKNFVKTQLGAGVDPDKVEIAAKKLGLMD